MELSSFGVDTVRPVHDLVEPLPMSDAAYRRELAEAGWSVNVRTERDAVLGLHESRTAFFQDPENDTIRAQIQNAGRTLVLEYSVPRVLSGTVLNTQLASPVQVRDVTQQVLESVLTRVPVPRPHMFHRVESTRYRRVDVAADVAAGDARPGLIAAAGQFVVPGARKIVRTVFPGETGRVTTTQLTFRGYDKGRELENKVSRIRLDEARRAAIQEEVRLQRERGIVRLELALTPKKSSLTESDVQNARLRWSDVVESGFRGGLIVIGGLDYIRREVDSRADLSPQSRNALIAFAVRYAELGEDGMLSVMSRATFFRHKRRFLDAGLRLDDVCAYSGNIDLRPVIQQVRAAV